jgi:hypothetical protein
MPRRDPGYLRAMMALLKAPGKLRPPGEPEALPRGSCDDGAKSVCSGGWSGTGPAASHRTDELVYVPNPLDARGRHALLHSLSNDIRN